MAAAPANSGNASDVSSGATGNARGVRASASASASATVMAAGASDDSEYKTLLPAETTPRDNDNVRRRHQTGAGRAPMPSGADTDARCPVCLDPPREALLTGCGHTFCGQCLCDYLYDDRIASRQRNAAKRGAGQCPVCRAHIKNAEAPPPRTTHVTASRSGAAGAPAAHRARVKYLGHTFGFAIDSDEAADGDAVIALVSRMIRVPSFRLKLISGRRLDAAGVAQCVAQGKVMAAMGTRAASDAFSDNSEVVYHARRAREHAAGCVQRAWERTSTLLHSVWGRLYGCCRVFFVSMGAPRQARLELARREEAEALRAAARDGGQHAAPM